jgi:hypothetical protein
VLSLFVIVPPGTNDDKPYAYCVYNNSELATILSYIYYWSPLASIIFNIFAFIYILWRVKQLKMIGDDVVHQPPISAGITTPPTTIISSYQHRTSSMKNTAIASTSSSIGILESLLTPNRSRNIVVLPQ